MPPIPTVFVVDDDASVRRGLSRLLRSGGYAAETFASATEFLANGRHQQSPACLVLDVRMPGLTGMDLQERLREAQIHHRHYLHHRPRRHPHERAGDEERGRGLSAETL